VEPNICRSAGPRRETPGSCNTFVIVGVLAAEPAGVQKLDMFQWQVPKGFKLYSAVVHRSQVL